MDQQRDTIMSRLGWIIGGLVLLAALAAPELEAAERSVHANMDEPFQINGDVYEAGRVTLREIGHYNPQTTMNEVWVGGTCLGLMLAERTAAPVTNSDDRLMFERDYNGTLMLVGFAYRGERTHEFYQYEGVADGGRWSQPMRRTTAVALASN